MRLDKYSVRKFKKEYDGRMFEFFIPQRLYDKTFKAASRKFAEMVSNRIGPDEERLRIRVFVATEHPLTELIRIIDRRDYDWIPDIYDFVLVELEEGVA